MKIYTGNGRDGFKEADEIITGLVDAAIENYAPSIKIKNDHYESFPQLLVSIDNYNRTIVWTQMYKSNATGFVEYQLKFLSRKNRRFNEVIFNEELDFMEYHLNKCISCVVSTIDENKFCTDENGDQLKDEA